MTDAYGGNDDRERPPRGETARQRLVGQLRLVLEALPDAVVEPPDWESTGVVDHVYRGGVVLVRDADLARVAEEIPGRVRDPLVAGLTAYETDLPTSEALAQLDRALGPGTATPDHVLWATVHSFCPATEPAVPASATSQPDPPVEGDAADGAGVLVSVVDTGWWPPAADRHAWLAGVTGDVEQPYDADGLIRPYGGHGTFAAGVVRAVAPQAEVHVEGVLPAAGAWYESDIVRQLYDAVALAPDVITVQAGTTTRLSLPLLAFQVFRETRLRHLAGTVLVAAAGNDGSRRPFWPAAFPWAIGVGALDATETARAPWSNHGSWVDVYARGVDMVNAYVDGTFVTVEPQSPAGETRVFDGLAVWSGTSFSTPYVAGLIAARASLTGVSGRVAADELLALAQAAGLPGVGPVARREMAHPDAAPT